MMVSWPRRQSLPPTHRHCIISTGLMERRIIAKKWAVVPFIFIQMVALSTLYYILPQFVIFKVCHRTFNRTVCNHLGKHKFRSQESRVFNEAAAWNAVIHFAALCPALIIILPLGALTDLVSKKKMLLVPATVNLVSCLINLCCAIFIKLHVGFLVISSFITSIFGEISGCTMLCCAYASSAADSHDRTAVLNAVVLSMYIGFGVGSLVGNYLLRYYGYPSVFVFVGTELIIGLLYASVLMPPTADIRDKPVGQEPRNLWNDFKAHMKDSWIHLVTFTKRRVLNSKDKTILLLFVAAFFQLASSGVERALLPLFLKHSPLSLTADKIGIFLTLNDWSRAIGLIFLAPIFGKYFRASDYSLMIIGSLFMFINVSFLSFSRTTLMVYLSTIFAIPSAFLSPSVRSQLTKLVSNEEYGVTLSFIGFVSNIGILVMAVGANGLFVATVKVYTGLSILLMAFTNIISLVILVYVVFNKERYGPANDDYNEISTSDYECE